MRLLIVVLLLLCLIKKISTIQLQVTLTIIAALLVGVPSLDAVMLFSLGFLSTIVVYPFSIVLRNLGLPQIVFAKRAYLRLSDIWRMLQVVLLEEFAWRVAILSVSPSPVWAILTSLIFVYLHFRGSETIVVMDFIELLTFTGILVFLAMVLDSPWAGVGLHLGRNVLSTLLVARSPQRCG